MIEKLKKRWQITSNWQLFKILIVFAITGSTAAYVGKPILNFFTISTETLPPILYWLIRIVFLGILYQFLLVFFGWVFGQKQFFLNFVKKMLKWIPFNKA